jgi:starvation-inducible DNA-binding protein
MAQVGHSSAIRSSTPETPPADGTVAFDPAGIAEISRVLNALLADSFALYLKTKNFHWRASGPHFAVYPIAYHLEFGEHADELFASTDELAARVRAIGGRKLPLGEIGQLRRVRDSEKRFVQPSEMLGEMIDDNEALMQALRDAHGLCERYKDTASVSLLETFMDQTERRSWFLLEISREADGG